MPLYLGLDCSTQGLSAVVIDVDDDRRDIVFERQLVFDAELPAYGTRHGVLPSSDPQVAVSPPLMWAEALDRMFGELGKSGLNLHELAAVSGSAQQHGSVYLNTSAADRLAALGQSRALKEQLTGIFSRSVAPIWMDTSTSAECDEITAALGGAARVAALTGSRAFERFTGPQIRRFAKREPDAYGATSQIHLVSSFMASLLLGQQAPLDPGDASGMNLMDLATSTWSHAALDATAPDLEGKLPRIVPATTVIGSLAPYWQTRYDLPPARVVVWTGDNPSSLVGTGLHDEGTVTISLGTSDTIFGPMREQRVDRSLTGHVFASPTGQFMGLTCFRNGSLARERVRDAYGLDWPGFARALATTELGNRGGMLLPWFEPEITPAVPVPGVHRQHLDPNDGPANVRAVIEAQMMSMANHSQWMEVEIRRIHATGGATATPRILTIMAEVFGADVYRSRVRNSACLGAALRAWHADQSASGRPMSWPDIMRGLAEPQKNSRIKTYPKATRKYDSLRRVYAEFEAKYR